VSVSLPVSAITSEYCRFVERVSAELAPSPEILTHHLRLVQEYMRGKPGSHQALMAAAGQEPEEITMSIVALAAVLLDIAAGAFQLTPEQMLDKVALSIEAHPA
jgi:hypothetical protein